MANCCESFFNPLLDVLGEGQTNRLSIGRLITFECGTLQFKEEEGLLIDGKLNSVVTHGQ
jgi:hypothetical protein